MNFENEHLNSLRKIKKSYDGIFDSKLTIVDTLLNFTISMFEYKGLPETIDTNFFEKYLNLYGKAGIIKDDFGTLFCGRGTLAGDINYYDFGNIFVGGVPNYSYEKDIYTDCALCFNNATHTPNLILFKTAELLGEIMTSISMLTINSRSTKAFIARNDKVKQQIDAFFSALKRGEHYTLSAENILNDLFEKGEVKDVDELHISDPSLVHDYQFLINAYDSILRWYYNFMGHGQNSSNKLAQQSVREIENSDSASLVLPLEMLKERKKCIDKVNEYFGLDASVAFSEMWENEQEEIEENTEAEAEEREEGAENEKANQTNE